MKDGTSADEADAGNDLGGDAGAISGSAGELAGEDGEHGRAKTDEHVGAQAGRAVAELALQADRAAEEGGENQAGQRRTQDDTEFVAQFDHGIQGVHRAVPCVRADFITGGSGAIREIVHHKATKVHEGKP